MTGLSHSHFQLRTRTRCLQILRIYHSLKASRECHITSPASFAHFPLTRSRSMFEIQICFPTSNVGRGLKVMFHAEGLVLPKYYVKKLVDLSMICGVEVSFHRNEKSKNIMLPIINLLRSLTLLAVGVVFDSKNRLTRGTRF